MTEIATFEAIADTDGQRQLLGQAIQRMAAAKAAMHNAPTEEGRNEQAEKVFRWGLFAVGIAIGQDALKRVYGPGTNDAQAALSLLATRLMKLHPLFDRIDKAGGLASFASLRDEIIAVANGDVPALLSRVEKGTKGKSTTAYRKAKLQLRALCWEAHLRKQCGMRASDAQDIVKSGFGRTWEAIRTWKADADKCLGRENVALSIQLAEMGNDFRISIAVEDYGIERAIKLDAQVLQDHLNGEMIDPKR